MAGSCRDTKASPVATVPVAQRRRGRQIGGSGCAEGWAARWWWARWVRVSQSGNHFFCFSLGHLDHIVQTYVDYYNKLRPHQSLGNVPLDKAGQPPPESSEPIAGAIGPVRHQRLLGGLINHYERKAA